MANRKLVAASGILLIAAVMGSAWGQDWPQFRGPGRDGKSPEKGLLKKWPAGGPKLLWKVDGLGKGYASTAVAGGRIYTTGMTEGIGYLSAFNMDGRLLWRRAYGPEWKGSFPGTRTTPTVDGERIYLFSGMGGLICLDSKTGSTIWSVQTLKRFEGKNIRWGMTGSPLVDGRKIYCTPGGTKGTIVALDKFTGRTIWATTGLNELSAYCSPILIEIGTRRLLVNVIQKSIVCVDSENGKLLWRVPYRTSYDTAIVTPVYHDRCLFVTSVVERSFTTGGLMLQLSGDGSSVEVKWNQPVLDCHHGGVVLVDGYLYGSNFKGIARGDWVCIRWDTGEVMYERRWNGNKGSVIYADGMLYCYDENRGDVALVKACPEGFELVSSFRVVEGSGKHWAHPAISDGRLYIRHGQVLMAYDIKDHDSHDPARRDWPGKSR